MAVPRLVLASGSPRRRQLLDQIGVAFEMIPQDIDESRRDGEAAGDFVARLARGKALAARTGNPGAVILAADTIVVCDDTVLGKPGDRDEALTMLAQLSGREHQVLTAIAVADESSVQVRCSDSRVEFRAIDPEEAALYWDTGEPQGKAGAYGIQGLAAVFVKNIAGSYSGVMGLPLFETAQLLKEFGIPCWQVDRE